MIGYEILKLRTHENHQALMVLDGLSSLPQIETLLTILRGYHVHVIVINDICINHHNQRQLIKEVDLNLVRGCKEHEVPPLSVINSQQRIVHSVMTKDNFAPNNDDQHKFEKLAELTIGSPVLVKIIAQAAQRCFESTIQSLENSNYDSWKSILAACNLEPEEILLLNCLTIFNAYPIFFPIVVELASLIMNQNPNFAGSLHHNLEMCQLLHSYPPPVIYSPEATNPVINFRWVYVPKYVSQCIWATLEKMDRAFAFILVLRALRNLRKIVDDNSLEACFLNEACSCLQEKAESNYSSIGKECYKELYSFCLKYV